MVEIDRDVGKVLLVELDVRGGIKGPFLGNEALLGHKTCNNLHGSDDGKL